MIRAACVLSIACGCVAAGAQSTAPEPDAASRATARRPDERRPEQPFSVDWLGRPLELGASWDFSAERRRNFDLDAAEPDARDVLDHELKFDARWRASDRLSFFAQLVAKADRRSDRADGRVRERHSFERGQMWVQFDEVGGLPLSVQAGRLALIERRSWWWDDDLDAVRLVYSGAGWRLETGLACELARVASNTSGIAADAKGVTRWFGNAAWTWAPRQSLETFWLIANDGSGAPPPGALFADGSEDASDARLRWFGLRAAGELRHASGHRVGYRSDLALLRGRETVTAFDETDDGRQRADDSATRRVRGHAWDIGAYWSLPGAARTTFSVGWAQGSGGERSDRLDHDFRQTGLQENKGRVGGTKRLRYYGGLLDPELSNLRIAGVGAGVRFLDNSSAELLLHRYRQPFASNRLAGSRLGEDPEGTSRDIGREIDLFIALREWRHIELTLLLARFRPGPAFAPNRRDAAHAAELGVTLTF